MTMGKMMITHIIILVRTISRPTHLGKCSEYERTKSKHHAGFRACLLPTIFWAVTLIPFAHDLSLGPDFVRKLMQLTQMSEQFSSFEKNIQFLN